MGDQGARQNVFETNLALFSQRMRSWNHCDGFDRWQGLNSDLWSIDGETDNSDVEVSSVDPVWNVDPSCGIDAVDRFAISLR
jgi:hypothetical protein